MKTNRKNESLQSSGEYKAPLSRTDTDRADCVKEPQPAYARSMRWGIPEKKQGEYTLDDYYAIPEDYRVELIDGVIYDMSAPGTAHQSVASFIFNKIFNHILEHKGKCISAIAPYDVQIDRDERTMTQPDIMITCDRKKITSHGICGSPDFIAEILSPSTRRKDTTIKLQKYRSSGVREYWIIDPGKKQVLVYDLSSDTPPAIYGPEDKVPIGILNHECIIDFHDVYEYVRYADEILSITEDTEEAGN